MGNSKSVGSTTSGNLEKDKTSDNREVSVSITYPDQPDSAKDYHTGEQDPKDIYVKVTIISKKIKKTEDGTLHLCALSQPCVSLLLSYCRVKLLTSVSIQLTNRQQAT